MVLSITTPNSAGNQKVIRVQSPSGTHNSDTAHLHTAQRTFPCYSCAIITNRNINGWCTHCRYRESIHAGFSPTKGLRQYTNLFIFRFVYFNTAYAVDKVSCTVRLLTCIGLHIRTLLNVFCPFFQFGAWRIVQNSSPGVFVSQLVTCTQRLGEVVIPFTMKQIRIMMI